MGWLMNPIYTAISWIMLRWHDLWDLILPDGIFLGTMWDWVLAIVFLVITIRIILFPLFVKQIRSQRAMQALAPRMKELQEKYKGDQQTLRTEMMKLYQAEKVNPLMGCLPLLLQIPVFFGLFTVLRHLSPGNQPSYGWNQEQFDSAVVARLFNAPIPASFSSGAAELLTLSANGLAVKIVAGVLVIIMMTTTFMTSRQMILKTGWQQDPQQRMIQKLMLYGIPVSLLLSGWYFPIGVIIYWVVQNIVSLGQQYWVLHKYPPPASAVNAAKSSRDTMRSSAIARFFAGEPVRLPEDPARTSAPQRKGLFRRRSVESEAAQSAAPQRSLAPRPGAKPTQSKSTRPAADRDPATSDGDGAAAGSDTATANGAAKAPQARTGDRPAGAKTSGAKDSGAGGVDRSGVQDSGSQNGAQKSGSQKSGSQKSGGQKAVAKKSGGQRSGGQRKAPGSRKGSSKKGGSRR